MQESVQVQNVQGYLRIGEVAEFLGVSQQTLRNWEAKERRRVYRHPVNRYRIFRKSDLERWLNNLESSGNRSKSRKVRAFHERDRLPG